MSGRAFSSARARGFTMLEVIIVIVVIGVIFGLGAVVIGRAFESYDLARRATDVDWQGRVALERMARELRHVRSMTAADFAFAASEVRFIDVDGNAVCFRLAGGTIERSEDGPAGACGTTSPQPLADSIAANGLTFAAYERDGNPTLVVDDMYYVAIALRVVRGDIDETFRVTVQPRRY